jgi:hypothetical protein
MEAVAAMAEAAVATVEGEGKAVLGDQEALAVKVAGIEVQVVPAADLDPAAREAREATQVDFNVGAAVLPGGVEVDRKL